MTSLADRLRRHVETLARTPRAPGTPEHSAAAVYIREHLRRAGFTVRDVAFTEAGFSGLNLLTEPLPNRADLPFVIVGAHYDTVPGSPGADDNASAVAGLLELADWLFPRLVEPLHARVQLAAYDLEEYGMVGSWIHSRDLKQARVPVRGMLSLEMLGYTDHRPGSQRLPPHLAHLYPDVGDFIGVCGNDASLELLRTVTESLKGVDGLPVEALAVPGTGEMLVEVRLSDHSAFWDHGYPALMITDTSFFRNPHYHQASDRPETLEYEFLAQVTAGVCGAVERLLRSGKPPA